MAKPDPKVDEALRELAEALAHMGVSDACEVFYALLTPPEREKIALRWKLVCMLEKGMTQRAIAAKLGISLCKITRGSHELKYGPEAFRKVIRNAVDKERGGMSKKVRS
jgi:TrpR family transcriptional regulator, trp operon repressor